MRNRISFILTLFCCLFLTLSSVAQNKVTGTIVEEANGQAIPFVNVGLMRQTDSVFVSGAATNDKGFFEIVAVPDGDYRLQVSAIGFETYEQLVSVTSNTNLGKIKLKEGSTNLNEVVIVEKRPLFSVEGEKTMYNVAEDPSIQTGTASDALQNAPGVEVDVEGNITLRGTSSVEVWINDKPSHMSEENLKTYIQQLPANSIDHVEVITNPSARYGSKADGIINIVTNAKVQKNEFYSFGVNGSTRPSVNPWFSYVWSNNKLTVNAYINGGFSIWKNNSTSHQWLLNDANDTLNYEFDTSFHKSKSFNTGGYFSLDYEIDSANSINFWASGWPNWNNSDNNEMQYREEYFDENGIPLTDTLITDLSEMSLTKNSHYYANAGVYYQHKFDNKGHNISVSLDGDVFGGKDSGVVDRVFTLPVNYTRTKDQKSDETSGGFEAEVVYNRPYSKNGEISVGINSAYHLEKEKHRTDTLVGETWINDAYRSHLAKFTDVSNEVFFTLQHKFGGFTIKPGIRFVSELAGGAYADSTQYNFLKHFFSVRPSLHLSYRTKSMHNFRASYTMRITAPEAEQLSSFPLYHEDSYSTGNPELDRIFTHSVELGWTKYWDKFGSIGLSAYYRGKTNSVNSVMMSQYHWLYGRVVPYSYPVNVGQSHNTGLEFNMMYRPTGFFNIRFYANVYDNYIKTEFNGAPYKSNMWSYSFRLNIWAKLWKRLEITASGYYSSPTQSLFSERHARYGINAGLRADFFNRMMTVFVNANDIFNWNKWGSSNNSPYVISTSDAKFNSRSVSLGLQFRFGKMELEKNSRQGGDDSQGQPQGMGM